MRKAKTRNTITANYNQQLVNQLTSLERQLLRALQERLARTHCMSAHAPTEFMDIASDSEMDDLAARIAESDSVVIGQIEEALRVLREGSYGTCQNCETKITRRRLKARPFATLCLECKQEQERRCAASEQPAVWKAYEGAGADVGTGESDDDAPSLEKLFRDVEASEVF